MMTTERAEDSPGGGDPAADWSKSTAEQMGMLRRWLDRGDEVALNRLFEALAPKLTILARLSLGRDVNRVAPEELVDVALMEVVDRLDEFDPDGDVPLVQWIGRRVHWRARDAQRRLRRGLGGRDVLSIGAPGENGVTRDARRDRAITTPSSHARRSERDEHLYGALRRLREKDRDLIHKRWLLGLPYSEIAAEDERSEEALRQAARTALDHLRTALARTDMDQGTALGDGT